MALKCNAWKCLTTQRFVKRSIWRTLGSAKVALGMCLDNGAQTGFFVQDFSPPAFLFEACVCV